jgi:hypothetical protein
MEVIILIFVAMIKSLISVQDIPVRCGAGNINKHSFGYDRTCWLSPFDRFLITEAQRNF